MRTRLGSIPGDALGVWYIGYDADSGPLDGWALVRRPNADTDWRSFKLLSIRPRKGAANYWLAWHARTKRFARTHDAGRLAAAHPAITEALRAALTDPLLAANFTPTAETAALAELRSLMGDGDALGGMLD